MVERKVHAGRIGQVSRDVAIAHVDLSVLHVFGVHELDLVDQVHFVEQHGADQSVEIAASDEAILLRAHKLHPSKVPGFGAEASAAATAAVLQAHLKVYSA